MASLRRNNLAVGDNANAKFLYTIIKQLDHRNIDWNLVAKELGITNGHAARMRFSRFKQHMDGPSKSKKANASTGNPMPTGTSKSSTPEKFNSVTRPEFRRSDACNLDVRGVSYDTAMFAANHPMKTEAMAMSELLVKLEPGIKREEFRQRQMTADPHKLPNRLDNFAPCDNPLLPVYRNTPAHGPCTLDQGLLIQRAVSPLTTRPLRQYPYLGISDMTEDI
ncbi:hypothetical protein MMC25_000829 [Agyrium rufum]|nr:hypothetical protein [Agyrium rufum]